MVTPVQTASPSTGSQFRSSSRGAGRLHAVGTVIGGTVGGGLGADTLVVSSSVSGAEVVMTSKSDPNSASDGADSLSVASSMSNSTVYAGAGADNISVDSHLIGGQLFAGSGADTVMVGGSLGGLTSLADGADSLTAADANATTVLGGDGNDSVNFTGNVRDSSIVGGFGVDSLVLGNASSDFFRGTTVFGGSPVDVAFPGVDYITVKVLFFFHYMAIQVQTHS